MLLTLTYSRGEIVFSGKSQRIVNLTFSVVLQVLVVSNLRIDLSLRHCSMCMFQYLLNGYATLFSCRKMFSSRSTSLNTLNLENFEN